eukprot:TRINITY_DN19273_c0_g1_i1.p1 TRINITY_DN19273_c0_g1~~TRINITY_DN19273_c0_g1_i1.p1  ORF type:complete len:598 (+),score=108.47 TRINITY_DN19273_c0_g1_i1:977-2770(+)
MQRLLQRVGDRGQRTLTQNRRPEQELKNPPSPTDAGMSPQDFGVPLPQTTPGGIDNLFIRHASTESNFSSESNSGGDVEAVDDDVCTAESSPRVSIAQSEAPHSVRTTYPVADLPCIVLQTTADCEMLCSFDASGIHSSGVDAGVSSGGERSGLKTALLHSEAQSMLSASKRCAFGDALALASQAVAASSAPPSEAVAPDSDASSRTSVRAVAAASCPHATLRVWKSVVRSGRAELREYVLADVDICFSPSGCYVVECVEAERTELHLWLGSSASREAKRAVERAVDTFSAAQSAIVYRSHCGRECPALLRCFGAAARCLMVDGRPEGRRRGPALLRWHRTGTSALKSVVCVPCKSALRSDTACVWVRELRTAEADRRPVALQLQGPPSTVSGDGDDIGDTVVWTGRNAGTWESAGALADAARRAGGLKVVPIVDEAKGDSFPTELSLCSCSGSCGAACDDVANTGARQRVPESHPWRRLSAPPEGPAEPAGRLSPRLERDGSAAWARTPADDAAYVSDDGVCVWVVIGAAARRRWSPSAALSAGSAYTRGTARLPETAPCVAVPRGSCTPHLQPVLALCGAARWWASEIPGSPRRT